MLELAIYTGVASVATIAPCWKVRKPLAKMFRYPVLGWIISVGHAMIGGWILLVLFSFQSSVAGLSSLLASLIFAAWMWWEGRDLPTKTAKAA